MFLYILKITKYNCIKIGIASSVNRIYSHLRTYEEIDLKKSYVVFAKEDRTIRQLEKQILNDYYEYKIFNEELKKKDGYSELRTDETIKDILQDIKYKANKLKNKEIKLVKGIDLNSFEKPKYKTIQNETRKYVDLTQNAIHNENSFAEFIDLIDRNKDMIIEYSMKDDKINGIRLKLNDKDKNHLFYEIINNGFIFNCGSSCIFSNINSYRVMGDSLDTISFRIQYYDDIKEVKKYYDEIQFRLQKLVSNIKMCGEDIKNEAEKEMMRRFFI